MSKSFFSSPILGQKQEDQAPSSVWPRKEYEQMAEDVQEHGKKVTALDKARRTVAFTDVMSEKSTDTALDFEK